MEKKLFIKTFKSDEITERKIFNTVQELNKVLGFNISKSSVIRRAIEIYDFQNDLGNLKKNSTGAN